MNKKFCISIILILSGGLFFVACSGSRIGNGFFAGVIWWPSGTTLDFDFKNDRYMINNAVYDGFSSFINSVGSFSRGSVGTYFDSTGTLQVAGFNSPRLDHNSLTGAPLGLLVEEARTNSIPNNTMAGAVVADGVERTLNGNFTGCVGAACASWSTTLDGGSGSVSFASDAIITGDGALPAVIYQTITTVPGLTYDAFVTNGPGHAAVIQIGNALGDSSYLTNSNLPVSATTGYSFTATATTAVVQIFNYSTTSSTITSVSVQSGGVFPTGWVCCNLPPGTIASVAGLGTSSGINYIDVAFTGTAAVAAQVIIWPIAYTVIAAASGQTWTGSTYIQILATDANMVAYGMCINGTSAAGAQLDTFCGAYTSNTSTFARSQISGTLTTGTTAHILTSPFVTGSVNVGATINWKIRIGMPQLEIGSFPSSVIPTSIAAVTRAADQLTLPLSSSWYNSSAGTLYGQFSLSNLNTATTQFVADIDDSTINNRIGFYSDTSACLHTDVVTGGVTSFGPSTCSLSANQSYGVALSYRNASFASALSGTALTSGSSGAVPSVSKLEVGSYASGNSYLNGWIGNIQYYNSQLPSAAVTSLSSY